MHWVRDINSKSFVSASSMYVMYIASDITKVGSCFFSVSMNTHCECLQHAYYMIPMIGEYFLEVCFHYMHCKLVL